MIFFSGSHHVNFWATLYYGNNKKEFVCGFGLIILQFEYPNLIIWDSRNRFGIQKCPEPVQFKYWIIEIVLG